MLELLEAKKREIVKKRSLLDFELRVLDENEKLIDELIKKVVEGTPKEIDKEVPDVEIPVEETY